MIEHHTKLVGLKKYTERVDFDLRSKSPVRAQRGTIIPNWSKNPTTNPTTFLVTYEEVSLKGKKASHSNQSREIPQH